MHHSIFPLADGTRRFPLPHTLLPMIDPLRMLRDARAELGHVTAEGLP